MAVKYKSNLLTNIKKSSVAYKRMLLSSVTYQIISGTTPVFNTFWGYDPNIDYGTTFDVYVDSVNGNDANNGNILQPYRTIQAAINANAGKTIGIRAGVYRETINVNQSGSAANPTVISRYGTEKVVITGSELIPTPTLCTASDAVDIGPLYNYVYKFTVPLSSVASGSGISANIIEDDEALVLCGEIGDRPLRPQHYDALADHESFTILQDSSSKILGFNSARIVDSYPTSQLMAATAFFHKQPNVTGISGIASVNTTTKDIMFTNQTGSYEPAGFSNVVSLRNIPYNIKIGQWGYIVNGSNITIYFWPNNPANVTSNKIEVCTRVIGVSIGASVNYIKFRGIIVQNVFSASPNESDSEYLFSAIGGSVRTNLVLENVKLRNGGRPLTRGFGAITTRLVNYLTMDRFTIENIFGCFGMYISGVNAPPLITDLTKNMLIRRGIIQNVSYSGIRIFNQKDGAVMHCQLIDAGVASHSNKFNTYETCDQIIFYGINTWGAAGYATWQKSSRIHLVACLLSSNLSANDARSLCDQNAPGTAGNTPAQLYGVPGDSYIFNISCLPKQQMLTANTGVTLGVSTYMPIELTNSIIHGTASISATTVTRNNNVITGGGSALANEFSDPNAFVDKTVGNYNIAPGSAVRTNRGISRQAIINNWKTVFPQVPVGDWDLDINGDPIDWSNPPIGPAVNYDVPYNYTTWVDPPNESTAAVVGTPITYLGGYYTPGFNTPTGYQWYTSTNKQIWTPIVGATNASYTPIAGDANKYLGIDILSKGTKIFRYSLSTILASYPLSDPSVFHAQNYATGSTTSATIAVQNRPVVIHIYSRPSSSTADTPIAVNIGAPGRASGTGLSIPQVSIARRTNVQLSTYFIANPGSGNMTFEFISTGSILAMKVVAYYIDNAVGISPLTFIGGTTSNLVSSFPTTKNYSHVIAIAIKQSNTSPMVISGTGMSQFDQGTSTYAAWGAAWRQVGSMGTTVTTNADTTGAIATMLLAQFEVYSN